MQPHTKKLIRVQEDPSSKTKKPGMIYHYEVEVDGLGNFECAVKVPGSTHAMKDDTKRAAKVDKLFAAAVEATISEMASEHAG